LAKITLLTFVLVLASAGFLASWALDRAVAHVVEHEVIDLVDETNLFAQRVLRLAEAMRRNTELMAEQLPPEDPQFQGFSNAAAEFFLANPDCVVLELWEPEARSPQLEPLARAVRPNIVQAGAATTLAGFLQEWKGRPAGQPLLSEFGQIPISYMSPDGTPAAAHRALSLQAGARAAAPPEGPSTGPAALLVATFHFRALDSDLSRSDQTAMSSRHFVYLLNAQGMFLQHPLKPLVYDMALEQGQTLDAEEPALRQVFAHYQEFMSAAEAAEEDRVRKERGLTQPKVALASLHAWFSFSDPVPPQMLALLDPDPRDPEFARKRETRVAVRQHLNQYLHQHPNYRVSLPTRQIPRFKVRSGSSQQASLDALRRDLETLLSRAGVLDTIDWRADVVLKNFAIHCVRLPHETGVSGRYVDLAVGVSLEEISADVDAEIQSIRYYSVLLGSGAALLASFFSLVITRPLNKIIASTRRLAAGDYDVELPTNDRGEVGVLANAFRAMVEQIRERNRRLSEEQAEIVDLNETLSRLNASLETERDALEHRVRERTAELQNLAEELKVARDAAMEASRAKSAFLAQMSHELRTPLNAIIGYSELLIEEFQAEGSGQHLADLQKIIDSGRHLLTLINDILDLSKIEAGKMELVAESFEIRPLVENLAETMRPMALRGGNRLEWHCPDHLPALVADKTRLRQVLLNLLSNACKFTENGLIRLSVELQEQNGRSYAAFCVRDSGVGMTPEQMGKLFQQFTQVGLSPGQKRAGTGLGLAISQRFCQMMGGDIAVESQPGQGSAFTARIPLAGPVLAGPASLELEPQVHEPDQSSPVVLVIDNDPHARELLARYLAREGLRVVTASAGDEGIALARQLKPLFLTLDVLMPGVDGWEVLCQLKADPELCEIPVVMVTVIDHQNLGLALGAADYLTKPIDRDRLVALVARFRGQSTGGVSILVVDDDPATRGVRRERDLQERRPGDARLDVARSGGRRVPGVRGRARPARAGVVARVPARSHSAGPDDARHGRLYVPGGIGQTECLAVDKRRDRHGQGAFRRGTGLAGWPDPAGAAERQLRARAASGPRAPRDARSGRQTAGRHGATRCLAPGRAGNLHHGCSHLAGRRRRAEPRFVEAQAGTPRF